MTWTDQPLFSRLTDLYAADYEQRIITRSGELPSPIDDAPRSRARRAPP